MTSSLRNPDLVGFVPPAAVFAADWYTARLIGVFDPDQVIPSLLFGAGDCVLSAGGPLYRRPLSYRGEFPGGGSLSVAYGNDEELIVQGTSRAGAHVFDVLRECFPVHAVSRVDVCADYDFPGAFDALDEPLHYIARHPAMGRPAAVRVAGDWDYDEGGRTRYLGSMSSAYLIRLYEKGFELRSKFPDQEFSLDLVRVEAVIRPRSREKERAASLTLEELFASSPMGASVLSFLTSSEHIAQPPLRPASVDPEYWLARHYGKVLEKWLQYGDAELRAHLLTVLDRRGAAAPEPDLVTV